MHDGETLVPDVSTVLPSEVELRQDARVNSRIYWLTWLATVTFFAGFYSLLVPLPRYLAAVGLADWQIGLVLGAFGLASLVGRPIAGVASDRFGPRSVMLVGALSLTVGALGVAATTSVPVLFGLRVLQAIGYIGFTTAGTALVVSLVAPEERWRRLAVYGAAANLAISLTPAAIAALLEVAPVQAGLLASAAFGAAGGLLALRADGASPKASRGGQKASHANEKASRGRHANVTIWRWGIPRRLWLPMAAAALLGAGFASFVQFAPILADRRGVSAGALYTTYGVAIIATRVLGGRLLDRVDVGRVVAFAALLMLVADLVIVATDAAAGAAVHGAAAAAVHDAAAAVAAPGGDATAGVAGVQALAPLLPAAALIAASCGLFHPALLARHAELWPDAPGRATAAFYLAFDLGIGFGSWVFGFALQFGGLVALYLTAAVCAAAAGGLAPRLNSRGVADGRA